MKPMKKINNQADYNEVMAKINGLMAKGSKGASAKDLALIRELALIAQDYEQKRYTVEAPTTLEGMIEMKMFEMKLKQKDLAKMLEVSDTKLSLIMNGKQKPDISFLKAIYAKLQIDADFILQHA
jgi:HTH-type transcriptional regulator/antitoxin HigA